MPTPPNTGRRPLPCPVHAPPALPATPPQILLEHRNERLDLMEPNRRSARDADVVLRLHQPVAASCRVPGAARSCWLRARLPYGLQGWELRLGLRSEQRIV